MITLRRRYFHFWSFDGRGTGILQFGSIPRFCFWPAESQRTRLSAAALSTLSTDIRICDAILEAIIDLMKRIEVRRKFEATINT